MPGVGVAGPDLDQVVDVAKLKDAPEVGLQVALAVQEHREEAHVPGVVGVPLAAAAVGEVGDAVDGLEPVEDPQEGEHSVDTVRPHRRTPARVPRL